MRLIADLHVHSKYSRATSPRMDVQHLAAFAKVKGISLMGTGDFTHPEYFNELKRSLTPFRGDASTGLYELGGTMFMPTAEVSCIYSVPGKGLKRVHVCVCAPSLEAAEQANDLIARRGGKLASDGRPILGMSVPAVTELFMGVSRDFIVYPAHLWTPWFGALGSESGFDSIEECFEDQAKNVFALETGLSSDPPMNWRVSSLDKYCLLSNSDAHSLEKIGRECNVFELAENEISYKTIRGAIKAKDKARFRMTVEFFPEEGKYHWDGSRNCEVSMPPSEALKNNNRCPHCNGGLTLGVLHRVQDLADRPDGFVPSNAIPFVHLVPLAEVLAEALGTKGKALTETYLKMVAEFGSEFDVLANAKPDGLKKFGDRVAEAVLRVREGKVVVKPGYDGVFGEVKIFLEGATPEEKRREAVNSSGQKGIAGWLE